MTIFDNRLLSSRKKSLPLFPPTEEVLTPLGVDFQKPN